MKKLLLVALALMLVSSVSFAQGANKEAPGKVISVTVANPAKGVRDGTIKVADAMGNPVSYTVNSAATIVDASFNAITLNQLKEGSMIKMKTRKTEEGKEEAKAINVI
ncbi:MAG: hypothetical protein NTY34_01670 [Candidatus Omnitrophica bacterium]|nr:hypothetical protein [Candidatus Omnitrophota bacterium]